MRKPLPPRLDRPPHPEKGALGAKSAPRKAESGEGDMRLAPAEAKFIEFRRTANGIQNLNLENCWLQDMTGQHLTHPGKCIFGHAAR